MPELPEVETIRLALEPHVVGRTFERVEILDPRLVRPFEPLAVAAELEGERVAALERRGKYVIVRFESGRVLLIHLRMTGSLRHARGGEPGEDPYRRAVVRLDDGSDVAYRDVRRFGTWHLLEAEEVDDYLGRRLGREPLERTFTAKRLGERLADRRAPLKAALLDQRTVAGLGNIYVDEALWRAQLHPLRGAGTLDDEELQRLTTAIRQALRAGLARQGATLRDYSTPDGSRGRAQEGFRVYGRAGEPCLRCGTPIEKIRAGGRGTWYCPNCQAEPQAARRSASRPSRSRRQSSV
ncbi:MAG TPA: bifunctional DNA-formamidopyrimidine glycosylase/DNA-(apurinic or apyrimidinic site) lyase [Gaiellaceae bacterium]|nr:bifunctional DNA-formamidopyrimidine glycosylase/DNA-(apurinic or apyrimidinic site) lyase [Gaiellaceae bacterium]